MAFPQPQRTPTSNKTHPSDIHAFFMSIDTQVLCVKFHAVEQ